MISSGHFFAICIFIFHKPQSQTVILVYSTDLNPNLLKKYDTKSKYFNFSFFCNFVKKGSIGFFEFCFFFAFCVITLVLIKIQTGSAPQNDRLNFSFVKDEHIVGEKTARNCHKMAIYQLLFFCELAKVARGLRLHFRPLLLNQLKFRPVEHIKMNV